MNLGPQQGKQVLEARDQILVTEELVGRAVRPVGIVDCIKCEVELKAHAKV